MPNGIDKNWVRVCITVDGFRGKFGRWPTRIRLYPVALAEIRDDILTPESFARVAALLEFVPEEGDEFIAEDATGARLDYAEGLGRIDEPPDISTSEWFGELEHRPHPPTGIEAAVDMASKPNYLGSTEVVSKLVGEFMAAAVELHAKRIKGTDFAKQSERIRRIFSGEDADFAIMPGWHTPGGLGKSVGLHFDPTGVYLSPHDECLFDILGEGLSAFHAQVSEILKGWEKIPNADWERDALPKLNALHHFATAVLMGTTTVFYPGKQLKDFGWNQTGT